MTKSSYCVRIFSIINSGLPTNKAESAVVICSKSFSDIRFNIPRCLFTYVHSSNNMDKIVLLLFQSSLLYMCVPSPRLLIFHLYGQLPFLHAGKATRGIT